MTKQTEAQSLATIHESLASNYSALPLQKLHNDTAAELLRLDAVEQAYNALLEKQPENVLLSEKQKQELAENWFSEDWCITKAIGMMYDYDKLLLGSTKPAAQRHPLTDAQIHAIDTSEFWFEHTALDFARAIEAAHGIT